MIYLFSACQCQPCQLFCNECAFSIGNWFHKPLGPYVILAMLLSGLEIFMCLYALIDEDISKCVGRTVRARDLGLEHWLEGQFGFACLHFIFAPYIQFRLWQNLQQEAAEVEQNEAQRTGQVAQFLQPNVFVSVPQHLIREAFWNIFWHDFGVCGYVFATFFSGFWSYLGTNWFVGSAFCDPDGYISSVAQLGSLFMVFVVLYFIGFSMYMSCVTSMEVNPKRALAPMSAGGYSLTPQQPPVQGMPAGGSKPFFGGMFGGSAPQQQYAMGPRGQQLAGPPGFMPPGAAPAGYGQTMSPTPSQRAMRPAMIVKLIACLGLDLMGDATYFIPGLGEGIDLAYAPAQAIALKMMFRYSALPALGFVEEILPGTDIIPSATLGWMLEVFAPDNGVFRAIGVRSDYSP